jgi:AcrR family transcriptional regulator
MPKVSTQESPGTRDSILAAARKVLLVDGLAGISTRRVASVAGVNQALVHYHFGSIENLLLDVLDTVAIDTRRSERIFYGSGDLLSKWRTFMHELIADDVPNGTTKIWLETVAMVGSKPESRDRYLETIAAPTHERLYEVVRSGLPSDAEPSEIEGITALIMAVRKSISVDALIGWNRGHLELLQLVDSLISQRIGPRSNHDPDEPADQWPTSLPTATNKPT